MGWPYDLATIPPEERKLRRLVLDRYGTYAQLLVLIPVVVVLVFRAASWASKAARARYVAYDAIPDSPSLKSQRLTIRGTWAIRARQVRWWLEDDVLFFGQHWGRRDEWIVGIAWASSLLLLCVLETGRDYLHLTKRFGKIAASQFPVQFLLSLKYLNPFAFVFRSSHEQVNRWHRVLGRIIYILVILHAVFYLNYFAQVGVLKHRLTSPVVVAGILAFSGFSLLNTTAIATVRRYSYRLFFIVHLIVAFAMPAVLFYHARPTNVYMAEALLVLIADLTLRKIFTVTSQATLESIPGTNLIRISTSIPYSKIDRFRDQPGSHIYLSVPAAARPSSNPASPSFLLYEFLFNPFTVASVDEENGDLTLVARQRNGPLTSTLAKFASGSPGRGHGPGGGGDGNENAKAGEGKVPLSFEGPYGSVRYFPNLAGGGFDRVLLVAGGVGATFTVPIYRALVHDNPNLKVDLVWAVRSAGDATWAVMGKGSGANLMADDHVHIFLTGNVLDDAAPPPSTASRTTAGRSGRAAAAAADGEDVELSPLHRDPHQRNNGHRYTAQHHRRRPDLGKVVDDAFRHGSEERVAVLVCGPDAMARELRAYVRAWVMKGRSVWWHNESFGW